MGRDLESGGGPRWPRASPRAPAPSSAPGACHVLSGPGLPAGSGTCCKVLVASWPLGVLMQTLGFFLECCKGFQRNSGLPHPTRVSLSHVHSVWSEVSGGSWENERAGCRWAHPLSAAPAHHCSKGNQASSAES